jgi:ornithine carbamoyltransferase
MSQIRHFLTLMDLSPNALKNVIQRAMVLKKEHREHHIHDSMKQRVAAMIFEKSSTRTRLSFEAGMAQLGGHATFLSPRDIQLGRGEPLSDTAKVISRMVDVIIMRTSSHQRLEEMAKHSRVPVINALSDLHHPCQLLADIQTFEEHRGDIQGKTLTWIGDGNNMCNSYMEAAKQFDFQLNIACPTDYRPNSHLLDTLSSHVQLFNEPHAAVTGSHAIITDVWASMGQEEEQKKRERDFANFQVTRELMQLADPQAIFMHCLPAHREEEVTTEVIDGPQSVVWDEAENRLHSQKALLEQLLLG